MKNEKMSAKDIKKKILFEELVEVFKMLLITVILCGIFAYIGYSYSINNSSNNIFHDTIFMSIYPIPILLLFLIELANIASIIIYTLIFIVVADFIPTWVGILIFVIVAITFAKWFFDAFTRDRRKEIKEHYRCSKVKLPEISNDFKISSPKSSFTRAENNSICTKCGAKINLLIADLNDGLCDECYKIVNTDENGVFQDPLDTFLNNIKCTRCGIVINTLRNDINGGLCDKCYEIVHPDEKSTFTERMIRFVNK